MSRAPGERLRSRLNWLILKTLAVDIGLPLAAAELYEVLRVASSRSMLQAWYRMERRSHLWVYLRRLADKGYVRLATLQERRRATLTPAGRRAVLALERLLRDRGERELLSAAAGLPERVRRLRQERLGRPSYRATLRRMASQRRALLRRIPGRPRALAFVSYDFPRPEHNRRRLVASVLQGYGFQRMHQSMYTGPSDRLRAVLEHLETAGVLQALRWGTITVFHP